jgi:hypothetical protein
MGVKGKLLSNFCIFSLIIIVLLWLLQIVLLADVYRWIKIRNVRTIAEVIDGMNEEDDEDFVVNQASSFDICTDIYDENMRLIVGEHAGGQCVVHNMSSSTARLFYNQTKEMEGQRFQSYLPAEEISGMLEKSELSYENFLWYFRFDRGEDAFYYQQAKCMIVFFTVLLQPIQRGKSALFYSQRLLLFHRLQSALPHLQQTMKPNSLLHPIFTIISLQKSLCP